MTTAQALKAGVDVDAALCAVSVDVPASVYGREAVLGAAYVFIDRCYVIADAPSAETYRVTLTGRAAMDVGDLRALGGSFCNELLAQQLRHLVSERNRALLEAVVGGAVAGAVGDAPAAEEFDLSALESMEFEDEPFEDPLGIAMSWEEKYGSKRASKQEAAEMKESVTKASGGDSE